MSTADEGLKYQSLQIDDLLVFSKDAGYFYITFWFPSLWKGELLNCANVSDDITVSLTGMCWSYM